MTTKHKSSPGDHPQNDIEKNRTIYVTSIYISQVLISNIKISILNLEGKSNHVLTKIGINAKPVCSLG